MNSSEYAELLRALQYLRDAREEARQWRTVAVFSIGVSVANALLICMASHFGWIR